MTLVNLQMIILCKTLTSNNNNKMKRNTKFLLKHSPIYFMLTVQKCYSNPLRYFLRIPFAMAVIHNYHSNINNIYIF